VCVLAPGAPFHALARLEAPVYAPALGALYHVLARSEPPVCVPVLGALGPVRKASESGGKPGPMLSGQPQIARGRERFLTGPRPCPG